MPDEGSIPEEETAAKKFNAERAATVPPKPESSKEKDGAKFYDSLYTEFLITEHGQDLSTKVLKPEAVALLENLDRIKSTETFKAAAKTLTDQPHSQTKPGDSAEDTLIKRTIAFFGEKNRAAQGIVIQGREPLPVTPEDQAASDLAGYLVDSMQGKPNEKLSISTDEAIKTACQKTAERYTEVKSYFKTTVLTGEALTQPTKYESTVVLEVRSEQQIAINEEVAFRARILAGRELDQELQNLPAVNPELEPDPGSTEITTDQIIERVVGDQSLEANIHKYGQEVIITDDRGVIVPGLLKANIAEGRAQQDQAGFITRAVGALPPAEVTASDQIEGVNKDEVVTKLQQMKIVILPGIGQPIEYWQNKIDFYKSKGIEAVYLDLPPFNDGDTFDTQADWIHEQILKIGGGNPVAIESHSWGELDGFKYAAKHPEMIDHFIGSSAPSRSDDEPYPNKLVLPLRWALNHPKVGQALIDAMPKYALFKRVRSWQECFRIYLGHIGKKGESQWDKDIPKISPTVPMFLMNGDKDGADNTAGWRGILKAVGAVIALNPNGGHKTIAREEAAYEIHLRLTAESIRRKALLIKRPPSKYDRPQAAAA